MTEEHNPPAFPTTPENETRLNGSGGTGMSLRDWFAGQALSGMCNDVLGKKGDAEWFEQYGAPAAYKIADAMLAARAKGGDA